MLLRRFRSSIVCLLCNADKYSIFDSRIASEWFNCVNPFRQRCPPGMSIYILLIMGQQETPRFYKVYIKVHLDKVEWYSVRSTDYYSIVSDSVINTPSFARLRGPLRDAVDSSCPSSK